MNAGKKERLSENIGSGDRCRSSPGKRQGTGRGSQVKIHPGVRRYVRNEKIKLDLLVRTPADFARRLRWGDPFICGLLEKGKVLYEANDA